MKLNKVLVHASLALGAMIVLMCIVAGCGKQKKESLPEVYPAEDHGYMKDPEFRRALAQHDEKRNSILGEREKLFAKFAALEKEAGSRQAAERSAEWKVLLAQADRLSRAYESNRWETTELLRERMKRAQEDSARIARGEAKPKEISK